MDLLSVLGHEVGHLLGYEHQSTGVMINTLPAGTQRTPDTTLSEDGIVIWVGDVDTKRDGW